MDKNLRVLLEVLNSSIEALNKNGYKIYDNDNANENFFLKKISYNSISDELVFECDYE